MTAERRRSCAIALILALLLTLGAGVLRFYRANESVHPDSLLWFVRTQRFWAALGERDFGSTNLAPHPGVMLMWISGLWLKLRGGAGLLGGIDPAGLFAIKLPGALVGTLAAALTFPLASACLGPSQRRPALLLAAMLATEPLLIEHSRMAHLDMAALGFAWLGLWVAIYAYEREAWLAAFGAGALFGAAALTKMSFALVPAGLMPILVGADALTRFRERRGLKVAGLATLAALVTLFALWPALWVHPVSTLLGLLEKTQELAEQQHAAKQLGAAGYWVYIVRSTPVETGLLALFGVYALAALPGLRKHFGWLLLCFAPYLLAVLLAKKELTRYILPASPLICLLSAASLEWIAQRAGAWLTRAPQLLTAAMVLLFAGRFVRDAEQLPISQQCTSWPGIACERPADMYFMRELALGIRQDMQASGTTGKVQVYVERPQLMSPWLRATRAKKPKRADYIVVWDWAYADAEAAKLKKPAARLLGRLGKQLVTVRHDGHVVARLYRRRR